MKLGRMSLLGMWGYSDVKPSVSPNLDIEPAYSDWRVLEYQGGVYIIRDVLHKDGRFSGGCQYAARRDDELTWLPCGEGALFAHIEPFARLTDG